jgi:hypothetical protein
MATATTPTIPTLTARQVKVLQGLYYGSYAVSATERSDSEIMDLVRKGYAGTFIGPEGSLHWRIATRGRNYLRDNAATPSPDDDLMS